MRGKKNATEKERNEKQTNNEITFNPFSNIALGSSVW